MDRAAGVTQKGLQTRRQTAVLSMLHRQDDRRPGSATDSQTDMGGGGVGEAPIDGGAVRLVVGKGGGGGMSALP